MNWASHPYLYQVVHPWHWLTYGQHFSAFASLSSVLIAVATLIVVVRQTKAANRQAAASEAQVKSANEASKVSLAQLDATKQAAEAEKLHSSLIYLQLLDSMQPCLAVIVDASPSYGVSYWIENQGRGIATALDVRFADKEERPGLVRQNMIAPGNKCKIEVTGTSFPQTSIEISCRSQDGDKAGPRFRPPGYSRRPG